MRDGWLSMPEHRTSKSVKSSGIGLSRQDTRKLHFNLLFFALEAGQNIKNVATVCQKSLWPKTDRPSIQSGVRPTDSPSSLTETQNKYYVDCYDIYSIHSHYKGNHKRGGAAEGRATSFVVATNRVDIIEVNTIFVFRLSKTGRTVGRTYF